MTSTGTSTVTARPSLRGWPAALGLGAGIGIGLGNEPGVPAVILVCASIYVLAAAVGRPAWAWIGFAASIPIVAVARFPGATWLAVVLAAVATAVVLIIGAVRHAWRGPARRRQLLALAAFALLALAVLALPPVIAGGLAAAALIAHAAWDVVHHRRAEVVTPAYAEFCAVLDLVLAGVVIVLTVVRAAG
jgi:hypothetical protein